MMMRYVFRFALLSSITMSIAPIGAAVYSAAGSINATSRQLDSFFKSSANLEDPTGTTQYEFDGSPLTLRASGSATSGVGGLKASASASATAVAPFTISRPFTFGSSSSAGALWSDFIVSGPAGPATIPISLNLELDGTISTFSSASNSQTARGNALVQMYVSTPDNNTFSGIFEQDSVNGNTPTIAKTGLLSGFNGVASNITTPVFNVPVNTPFPIELFLSINASTSSLAGEAFTLSTQLSFLNTLKFATSGPVFNLPAGYSIDSVTAGIVDNAIPEVSSLSFTLLAMVLCSLICLLARRRTHQALVIAPNAGQETVE